jgi:hypothetical protein
MILKKILVPSIDKDILPKWYSVVSQNSVHFVLEWQSKFDLCNVNTALLGLEFVESIR